MTEERLQELNKEMDSLIISMGRDAIEIVKNVREMIDMIDDDYKLGVIVREMFSVNNKKN